MSVLKLLDEDPVPEPDKEVVLPETPPGLDAIKAWMRKPRPRLHGIKLWIKHILSAGPVTWKWLREHVPRMVKWLRRVLRRIANRGAPAVRPLAEVGEVLRELGERIHGVADELRDLLGKQTPAGTQLEGLGRIAQAVGGLIVSTAKLLGRVLKLIGKLLALLPKLETPPAPAPPPDTPEPPPEPDPNPPEDPKPDKGPAKEEPDPNPPEDPKADKGPAKEEPEPDPPGEGTPEPVPTPVPDPNPDPTPEPDPNPNPPPEPDPSPEPPPEPDPDSSPSTPPPPPEPAPTVPSEADLKARLKGLPAVLHHQVLANEGRTPPDILRPLILDICLRRDWSTSRQLARWLDMDRSSLSERHLGPLVRDGLLELKYPDRPRSPRQAYRTCRDRWPPRR